MRTQECTAPPLRTDNQTNIIANRLGTYRDRFNHVLEDFVVEYVCFFIRYS